MFDAGEAPVKLCPPEHGGPAPLVVLWHGFGLPADKESLAEALPLRGLDAWRAYVDLPLFGERLPAGGPEALMRRQADDYVQSLLVPAVEGAASELPAVVEACAAHAPVRLEHGVGLFGFSSGGMAVLAALAERRVPVAAAVTCGAPPDAATAVATYEEQMQAALPVLQHQFDWLDAGAVPYRWTDAARAAAARHDYAARAADVTAGSPPPALLLLHGARDEFFGPEHGRRLHDALRAHYARTGYPERLAFHLYDHLSHFLGHPDDAPVLAMHRDLERLHADVQGWFERYLR